MLRHILLVSCWNSAVPSQLLPFDHITDILEHHIYTGISRSFSIPQQSQKIYFHLKRQIKIFGVDLEGKTSSYGGITQETLNEMA